MRCVSPYPDSRTASNLELHAVISQWQTKAQLTPWRREGAQVPLFCVGSGGGDGVECYSVGFVGHLHDTHHLLHPAPTRVSTGEYCIQSVHN